MQLAGPVRCTYKYGWNTEIEMEYAPKGRSDTDIVRVDIQLRTNEPQWMLDWRLGGLPAFARWENMTEPRLGDG